MNILFLTSAFPSSEYPKSNAHNLRSVINLAKEAEIEIQVVHLRSWKPWRKVYKTSEFDRINVISYSFPYYPVLPKLLLGILLSIYKKVLFQFFLKKHIHNVDVIHTAGVSMESVVGAYIAKKTGLKHVAQCMGSDVNISLPRLIGNYGWKNFEKNVTLFCCNSISLQNELKKIFPLAKSNVIYRGVNINEFEYKPLDQFDTCNNSLTFLYLGGLKTTSTYGKYNYKGGVTLLKAWIKLYGEIDRNKVRVKLLYGGPNVNNTIISEILEGDPANLNIEVIGQLSINDVKNYIEKSSVVVIPSFAEGLPNVAMEAASIGRPVIGSEVDGIPEIVITGETGFLFKPGNENELSNLIQNYIMNPEQVLIHGENARNHVVNYFDSKLFVKKYVNIYKKFASKTYNSRNRTMLK